jgi:hypothetical protein
MGAAIWAKLAREGPLQVGSGEMLAVALSLEESRYRHRNNHIGRASRDVLALAAMALGFHYRLTFRHVSAVRDSSNRLPIS